MSSLRIAYAIPLILTLLYASLPILSASSTVDFVDHDKQGVFSREAIADFRGKLIDRSLLIFELRESLIVGTLVNDQHSEQFLVERQKVENEWNRIQRTEKLMGGLYFDYDEMGIRASLHTAYKELLSKIESKLSYQVLIYAEGFLQNMPWDALIMQDSNTSPPHYMIYDHEISMVTKPEHLNDYSKNKVNLLAVAPMYRSELVIGNFKEVKAISKFFKGIDVRRSLSTRNGVSDLFAKGASIIHFSAHAKIDTNSFKSSHILLSNENARISIQDIEKSNIAAPLVFLNTCLGSKIDSTGEFSISKALLGSGAKSTIATFWKIDDKAAQQIAIQTYQGIVEGMRIAEALRSAKISLIKESERMGERQLFNWAGYHVQGSNSTIVLDKKSKVNKFISWLISLMASLSMFHFYFSKYLRRFLHGQNWV